MMTDKSKIRRKRRLHSRRRRQKRLRRELTIKRLSSHSYEASRHNSVKAMIEYLIHKHVPFLLIQYDIRFMSFVQTKYELVLIDTLPQSAATRMLQKSEFYEIVKSYDFAEYYEDCSGCIYDFANFKELYNRLKRCSR